MKLWMRPLTLLLSSTASSYSFRVAASFQGRKYSSSTSLSSSLRAFQSRRRVGESGRAWRTMASTTTTDDAETFNSQHRVALCQFTVTPDKEKNHAMALEYITRAAQDEGAKLIVLPEIWNGPYATAAFAEYAEDLSNDLSLAPSAQLLQRLAQQHQVWIVGGSIPEVDNQNLYNTCLVFDPQGSLVAKHRKAHLFDIDVPGGVTFRESDTLSSGQTMTAFDTGDEYFGWIGIGICYDIRFPEYALLLGQKHRCNLLVYPGAFNLTTGPAHWELLQRARAVDNQCFVLTASPARANNDDENDASKYPPYTAWGHSTVVAPWGDIVATTNHEPSLVVTDLDMSLVQTMRQAIPTHQQKRHDLYQLQDGSNDSS